MAKRKTQDLRMFEKDAAGLSLATLIDSRMLLCANSGGGKSYALRKLLEQAGGQVMSIVLDYEGEFKTLREKSDFLLIGPEGDVPINMKAARLLPKKLFELTISTIIDISELKRGERIAYMKRFLEAVMDLPRKYWKPCLIVIDEAHIYAGQQEKQESTHAVIDLMTRGRKRGYCGILATQRISKLHKDAAAEANNCMVGRTVLDIDMKRAADILGFSSKNDMLSLRQLDPGEFFVFGPAVARGVEKVKVAKVATTHPQVGMDLKGTVTPPTPRIRGVLTQLNDLPQEAEKQAQTTRELKAQIRTLERQVKARPRVEPDDRALAAAEKAGYNRARSEFSPMVEECGELHSKLVKIHALSQSNGDSAIVPCSAPTPKAPVRPQRQVEPGAEGSLGRCGRAILSLLWNNPDRQFKRTMVGLFSGYSHKSGGFNNAICRLNALGLIRRVNGLLQVSPEGLEQGEGLLGDDVDLHEQFTVDNWATKLPKCASIVFRFLLEHPDGEFSKEEVGELTGYSAGSGGFNNAICQLNSLGLIVRGSGTIMLNREILER